MGTAEGVSAHRTVRKRKRLAVGEAWKDSGRFFTDELGHSTIWITQDLYQHVRLQLHHDSAEKVVALLPEPVKRA